MNKQEFTEALDEKLHQLKHCQSCGKPYTEHLGIIGTCAKLQEATKEIERLRRVILDEVPKKMRSEWRGGVLYLTPEDEMKNNG